ncbi:hypothetical protein [Robbsia andropogonis]|uniref:hypothetical protein n=2 Tax=Robbsia andropogonis TaxID=28092 RepID=UPI0012F9CDBD|nr:hypothetical protein [Robbsia andropogonis]MCP1118682.1 hypothetical protein [Robbsia andropogonis]MCP1128149.1 hypothetical protein [Robbsia andropogonis]
MSAVGKELGYDVSGFDKDAGSITLSSNAGLFVGAMIGKIQRATIMVRSLNGGRKLDLTVSVYGNFDQGGQEAATKRLNAFKEKLLEKVGQH